MADKLLEVRVVNDNDRLLSTSSISISPSLPSLTSKNEPSELNGDNNTCDQIPEPNIQLKPENRQCWVCLATDEEDEENTEWIHPCRCSGTAKWVHQSCLQQWIDEKQKYNSTLNVSCTQCNTEYMIVFPTNGRIFFSIDLCDRILYSASPLAAITCIVGSIYWSAVCYGAFTVMQVLGKESGKTMIEQSDPVVLLVGLPSIPVALILSKLIRWEDQILKLWFKNNFRFPLLGYALGKPADKPAEFTEHNLLSRDAMSDPIAICRNFCGALILPTAATFFGGLFFANIKSNFHRAILGGFTFIVSKGLIKIFLRQHQYIRQTHRKILNFDTEK